MVWIFCQMGQPDFKSNDAPILRNGIRSKCPTRCQNLFRFAQSAATGGNQNLIAIEALRDIARKIIAAKGEKPIGTSDHKKVLDALEIANTWLDSEILFPATSVNLQPAWSKRDWLINFFSVRRR
jgi:uncharacterized protein (DUF2342 family)